MELKTDLDVFSHVENHLLSQGKKAQNAGGANFSCRYRAVSEGRSLKCAVGCLITDAFYSEALEGLTVGEARVAQALESSGVNAKLPKTMLMLELLQSLHDYSAPIVWAEALRTIRSNCFTKDGSFHSNLEKLEDEYPWFGRAR